MKATLKSGRVIQGKLAEIFVRKGIAEPIEENEAAGDKTPVVLKKQAKPLKKKAVK